jgi:hypothetical protein
MADPIEHCARAAARRLATEFGLDLRPDVEAALYARNSSRRPERYYDPISLGALIVSIASLAWTVFIDLKKNTSQPSPDVVARTVRVQLRNTDQFDSTQRDRVIEIVVHETAELARRSN